MVLNFTRDCVLILVPCFPPWDPANTTSATSKVGGKRPDLKRAVELCIPCPQPTPKERLVSLWMQCVGVFKQRCLCFWHFTKVILKFLLKQHGRDAYGKVQHWYSQPHYKAPYIKCSSINTTIFFLNTQFITSTTSSLCNQTRLKIAKP